MPQHFANGINVRSSSQLKGSVAVPKAMEGNVLGYSGSFNPFLTGRFIHDGSGNPANTNNSPSFALRKDYMLALKLAYTQHLLSFVA